MQEVTYNGSWVLINAHFYSFWMLREEFDKYNKVDFYSNVAEACLKTDLIVIHTEWDEFKLLEFKKIVKKNNFKIFDMRNLYSSELMKKNKISYFAIGK